MEKLNEEDESFILEKLMDAILHNLREQEKVDIEAFEIYASRLRRHLYNPNEYTNQFIYGYQSLMNDQIK